VCWKCASEWYDNEVSVQVGDICRLRKCLRYSEEGVQVPVVEDFLSA